MRMIILFTLVSDFRELSISIFHIHVLKWVRKTIRKACILNSYFKTASFFQNCTAKPVHLSISKYILSGRQYFEMHIQDALKDSNGGEIELEEYGLGFDYVFKRVPTVSFYQVLLFIMSNWIFFCAGFTQVGSARVSK